VEPVEAEGTEETPEETPEETTESETGEEGTTEKLTEDENTAPVDDLDLDGGAETAGTEETPETGEGDQTEEQPEETETQYKEDQIKVPASSWPELRKWLEEDKGLDVGDMFGGSIEMEENGLTKTDDDINFDDVEEDDETTIKKDEDEENKEENKE
jgi:hypothetical protein